MSSIAVIPKVRYENARALASALGIMQIEQAATHLNKSIIITVPINDNFAKALADDVLKLLSRTIEHIGLESITNPDLEIVIGSVAARFPNGKILEIAVSESKAIIGTQSPTTKVLCSIHPMLRRLVACYVCAASMKRIIPELVFPLPDPLILDFNCLGINLSALNSDIELGKTYLAGAGAIGNALLWAMQDLKVSGELNVVDFDHVDEGNLQRQIWFDKDDLNQFKCDCLTKKAQPYFPNLKLISRKSKVQDLTEKTLDGWLFKLIVAVDSRRARRRIQEDVMPREVFDASTTDISEVIVHYHRQPTENACLSCIYKEDDVESSFEFHIADQLGIPVAKVRESVIDSEAANLISQKYPNEIKTPQEIVGLAYESLFKSLCGTGKLSKQNETSTVSPFAFVSCLAGVLLAVELVRRHTLENYYAEFNYWRVSPWQTPFSRNRKLHPPEQNCAICGSAMAKEVLKDLWEKVS